MKKSHGFKLQMSKGWNHFADSLEKYLNFVDLHSKPKWADFILAQKKLQFSLKAFIRTLGVKQLKNSIELQDVQFLIENTRAILLDRESYRPINVEGLDRLRIFTRILKYIGFDVFSHILGGVENLTLYQAIQYSFSCTTGLCEVMAYSYASKDEFKLNKKDEENRNNFKKILNLVDRLNKTKIFYEGFDDIREKIVEIDRRYEVQAKWVEEVKRALDLEVRTVIVENSMYPSKEERLKFWVSRCHALIAQEGFKPTKSYSDQIRRLIDDEKNKYLDSALALYPTNEYLKRTRNSKRTKPKKTYLKTEGDFQNLPKGI